MSYINTACLLILFLSLSACRDHSATNNGRSGRGGSDSGNMRDGNKGAESNVNCTCDVFPFPASCQSKCETGEATIESVNRATNTATVTIHRGGQTQQETISLSQLPPDEPAEKGAHFRTLYKKNAASPNVPRIVRFARVAK
jgi:hypothetical protein